MFILCLCDIGIKSYTNVYICIVMFFILFNIT